MTNILAIDHGTKRIGLAWVQDGLDVVLPFGVVENTGTYTVPKVLLKIIKEEHIDKLVIGLPISLNGDEMEHAKQIRLFGEELVEQSGLPVVYVDERFTSRQADAMGGDITRDEKAAMVILQSYCDAF